MSASASRAPIELKGPASRLLLAFALGLRDCLAWPVPSESRQPILCIFVHSRLVLLSWGGTEPQLAAESKRLGPEAPAQGRAPSKVEAKARCKAVLSSAHHRRRQPTTAARRKAGGVRSDQRCTKREAMLCAPVSARTTSRRGPCWRSSGAPCPNVSGAVHTREPLPLPQRPRTTALARPQVYGKGSVLIARDAAMRPITSAAASRRQGVAASSSTRSSR